MAETRSWASGFCYDMAGSFWRFEHRHRGLLPEVHAMPRPGLIDDIRQLSVSERLLLVEDIWDSIGDEPESWSLSAAQRQELERRAAAHRENPNEGCTWDELKAGWRART